MQFSILTQRCTVLYCTLQAFNSKSKISWKEHYFKKFLILISLITYLNQSTINATENHFFKQYFKSNFNVQNNTQIAAGSKKLLNLTGCNCIPGNNVYCIGQGNVHISSTNIPITLNGGYIYVEGSLIINRLQEFKGTHLLFGPNASISIANTGLLNINSFATLDICNSPGQGNLAMWQGIIIQSGGQLRLNQTTISNAYQGVEVLPGGLFRQMRKCTFNRNYIGVAMPNGSGHTIGINLDNNFICTDDLLPGYLLPIGITKTWAGIWMQGGVMTMTGSNSYVGLHNAIILEGANVTIRNQYIFDTKGSVRYPGYQDIRQFRGYGIICSHSAYSSFISNEIYTPNNVGILMLNSSGNIGPNIIDSWHGIDVYRGRGRDVYIEGNNINFSGTGINVDESDGIKKLHLLNNKPMTGSHTNMVNSQNTGIDINGLSASVGSNILIDHNTINIDKNGNGILIRNFSLCNITSNIINVGSNAYSNDNWRYGISVEGGYGHYFGSNFINAQDANLGSKKYEGIRLLGANNCKYCCNVTNGTYYGISFMADCNETIFGSNTFSANHEASLFIDEESFIGGPQSFLANFWPSLTSPKDEAVHRGDQKDVDRSLFLVRNDDNLYMPDPIYTPNANNWFIPLNGNETWSCQTCGSIPHKRIPNDPGNPVITDVDLEIIEDSSVFGYFDEGRQWNLKMELLYKLHTFPALLGTNSNIDSFYYNSALQSVGTYYDMRQNIKNLFMLSDINILLIDSLYEDIKDQFDLLDQQLYNLNLPGADEEAIYLIMDEIQSEIDSLSMAYDSIMNQFESEKMALAMNLMNVLNNLAAVSNSEIMEKRINQLLLKEFIYGKSYITLSEWQEIDAMAHTCIHEQRYAVLTARGLFHIYSDEEILDEGNCNQPPPIISVQNEIIEQGSIVVSPNPAHSQWIVELNDLDQCHKIKLYNNMGSEIPFVKEVLNNHQISIKLDSKIPGIYYLMLDNTNGIRIIKKLISN